MGIADEVRCNRDHFVASLSPGLVSPSFAPKSASSSDAQPRQQHILDVAGGTGDIAFRMLHHAHVLNSNPHVRVTVADINPAMLTVGAQRAEQTLPPTQLAAIEFVEANAEDMSQVRALRKSSADTTDATAQQAETYSIPSNSVDLYTVAFGIRNFTNIPLALREAHRVLKPGGVFACLEFSKADALPLVGSLFNAAYKRWSFGAIPLIGQLVAGDRDSYQYLVESIERFPSQMDFRDMIRDAGFKVSDKGYENLTGGVAAIHKGLKPLDR
jgi:2-methoxy-6-polyprenyl-1,4-benzoquinol methylase